VFRKTPVTTNPTSGLIIRWSLVRVQVGPPFEVVVMQWVAAMRNLVYVGAMRTVAGQGSIPQNESTDAHLLVDLSANYHVRSNLKLYLQVRNLTDKEYVAARRPVGARPEISRTVFGGISLTF